MHSPLVNGGHGPGQLAAMLAIDAVIAKARKSGVGLCRGRRQRRHLHDRLLRRADSAGQGWSGLCSPILHRSFMRTAESSGCWAPIRSRSAFPLQVRIRSSSICRPAPCRLRAFGKRRITMRWCLKISASMPLAIRHEAHAKSRRCDQVRLAGTRDSRCSLCVALLAGPLVGAQVGKALNGWNERGSRSRRGQGTSFSLPSIRRASEILGRSATPVSAYVAEIKGSRKAAGVNEISHSRRTGFRQSQALSARGCCSLTTRYGKSWRIWQTNWASRCRIEMCQGGRQGLSEL